MQVASRAAVEMDVQFNQNVEELVSTIIFSGAELLSVQRSASGGRLSFSCELTQSVAKAMGWTDLPDKCIGGKMEGAINGASLIFAPKQKDLFGAGEFRADCQTVGHFQIARLELEQSRGKGFRRELRFHANFTAEGVCAMAEAWLMSVGEGKGSLRVSGTIAETAEEPEEEEEGDEPPLRGEAAERHGALASGKAN